MALMEKKRLGDLLVEAGKITHFQLQEALKLQRLLGKKLGEVLVEQNILTELLLLLRMQKLMEVKLLLLLMLLEVQ